MSTRRRWVLVSLTTVVVGAGTTLALRAQRAPATADVVLTNGKIITVDDRFSIAQAIAIRGERIVAVGTNEEIAPLAGVKTRRIDLRGRAVVPGLIDNHAHIMEEGRIWQQELRLDGVDSRAAALEMVRTKANTLTPGAWVYTLGGWSIDQFTDDRRPFTREELDRVAPNNPVLLQVTRVNTYLNSRAIEAIGLDTMQEPWIARGASGRPTGVIELAGIARVARAIPAPPKDIYEAGSFALMADMNRAGLTTVGGPCPSDDVPAFQQWALQGRLTVRFFCFVWVNAGNTPEEVEKALPLIGRLKPFQGDVRFDLTAFGESVFQPLHENDNWLSPTTNPTPAQLALWRRIATEIAKAGIPLHVHAQLENTISGFLDQIEAINKEYPVRNLRWTLAHIDQVTPSHLERMKNLGLYAAVHGRPAVLGQIWKRAHGARLLDMPPLKMIQDSGVHWGLGSDTFEVNQYRPFTTLWWAVTGKMIGGAIVNRQPVSREEALIAHTRKNAYLVFQENNLGSIQPGKLADLVVLDRDYLTIPADQIKDITPVLTMVGGKVVYDAAAQASTR
jgi:predicted amidohydrolase YtcJ